MRMTIDLICCDPSRRPPPAPPATGLVLTPLSQPARIPGAAAVRLTLPARRGIIVKVDTN
jgi:hypothetical protein